MSEPITRADYAKWLLSCGDLEMHAMFEDWCAHNPAESASPPRVPGASAQFAKVGVQSGPGQPIDICERLDKDGFAVEVVAEGLEADGHEEFSVALRETAALEREAAAEIRRLRDENERLKLRLAEEALSHQEAWAGRFRAGIEAAAKMLEPLTSWSGARGALAAEVRALADATAPDPLLPGLSASVGDDGCWLHFKTTDGNRSASFHIANKFDGNSFMDRTVRQWCSEREIARKGG